MTKEQFLELNPCRAGREFALAFNTIKDAWNECKDVSNLIWLASKTSKCRDQLIIFTYECVSIAQAHAENAADAAYAYAYAYAAADAAAYAYDAADADAARKTEINWQVSRIKELCTDLIFTD